MILAFFLFCSLNYLEFTVLWFSVSADSLVIQTLLLYFIFRLAFAVNLYQLIGYSSLTLLSIGAALFWLQFDVFACFLLVAESIVLLFVLSILMHLNYTNLTKSSLKKPIIYLTLIVLLATQIKDSGNFSYWVDWYTTQSSQFNDLLPQYLYFYTLDAAVVVLTGLWLLILTLLLVHLILSLHFSNSTDSSEISYFRKTQNIWSQWYKKPTLRFFKK